MDGTQKMFIANHHDKHEAMGSSSCDKDMSNDNVAIIEIQESESLSNIADSDLVESSTEREEHGNLDIGKTDAKNTKIQQEKENTTDFSENNQNNEGISKVPIANHADKGQEYFPSTNREEANFCKTEQTKENSIEKVAAVSDIIQPQNIDISDMSEKENEDKNDTVQLSEGTVPDVVELENSREDNSIQNEDAVSSSKKQKGLFHKAADKIKHTVSKGFGMGKVAGEINQTDSKARFENSMGQSIMERKLSREELQKEILYQEETKIKEEQFSPQLVKQLKAYEKMLDEEKNLFKRELNIKELSDKDFFILVNTMYFSQTFDEFQNKLELMLPCIRLTRLTETSYDTYKEHAQRVIDETNKF